MKRNSVALAAIVAAALVVPAAAQAHVSVGPAQVPAGETAKIDVRVGHGCEDSPTTRITVRMPDSLQSAIPQVVPGWKISTRAGKLPRPFDNHGERVAEGVREVTWSGGRLEHDQLEEFGLSVRLAGKSGDTAYFKTVQECESGQTNWVEIPVTGEAELESPAPSVTLTAASSGEHGAEGHDTGDATLAARTAEVRTREDGHAPLGLSIAGLAVGGLGLLAGGAGIMSGRRKS